MKTSEETVVTHTLYKKQNWYTNGLCWSILLEMGNDFSEGPEAGINICTRF